jgi:hypothetical protein
VTDAHLIVGTADHYAALVRLFRSRIEALGITYATVDEKCGFPERYCATLMSGGKACSVYSLFTLAHCLALTPAFHHEEAKLAELMQRPGWIKLRRAGPRWRSKKVGSHRCGTHTYGRDYLRSIPIRGGLARAKKLTRKQRCESARKAALARWGPSRPDHVMPETP